MDDYYSESLAPAAPKNGLESSLKLLRMISHQVGGDVTKMPPAAQQQLTSALTVHRTGDVIDLEAERNFLLANETLQFTTTERIGLPPRTGVWDNLSAVPSQTLASHVTAMHPQLATLVLSRLPERTAASLVCALDESLSLELLRRLRIMRPPTDSALEVLEIELGKLAHNTASRAVTSTGPAHVARIFNAMDQSTGDEFLEKLDATTPGSAATIRKHMLTFGDIATLDAAGIQTLLIRANRKTLILALKGVSSDLLNVFLRHMTRRAGDILQAEIESLGRRHESEIDKAQREIVSITSHLMDIGEIGPRIRDENAWVE